MSSIIHPASRARRYMSPFAWWGDAWDARRTAQMGVPILSDPPPTPTGRQSEIGRAADNEISQLRRNAQKRTHDNEAGLARFREQIRQVEEKIEDALVEEKAVLDRPPERVLPAEAETPDNVVASRRSSDNRREAHPIRERIEQMVALRDQLQCQAAELDRDIEMCWQQARSRAQAVGHLARRREARYWRLLCRRHPEGARLADLFDHPRIALAPWVDGPADERKS